MHVPVKGENDALQDEQNKNDISKNVLLKNKQNSDVRLVGMEVLKLMDQEIN